MHQFKIGVHLILLNEKDELLMLRRFNTGFRDGEYSLVAGHAERGEDLRSTIVREAREEVGITIARDDLAVVGAIPSLPSDYVYFFLHANSWAGEVRNMEPHRCDDVRWFNIRELPENTVSYVRWAVENYLCGEWYSEMEVAEIP